MMRSSIAIADEILKIAKRKQTTITPMQLIKLAYIAHGWSLAILDRPLFEDRIEAWKYGPVISSLYQATKKYGRSIIPASLVDSQNPSAVDEQTQKLLEDVFEKYGNLTGIQLSNLTHRPGTPWHLMYRQGAPNIKITDDVIKDHYLEKLTAEERTAIAHKAASARWK